MERAKTISATVHDKRLVKKYSPEWPIKRPTMKVSTNGLSVKKQLQKWLDTDAGLNGKLY